MCYLAITRRDVDLQIARIAARQHNAFSRAQVLATGGDDALIHRRVRAGTWEQLLAGVYGLPGPRSFERRLWIGHLAAGPHSLVSHQAAGAVYGFEGLPPNRIALIGCRSDSNRIPGVTVHRLNDVLPHHRTTVSRLPITTRARTIVDLAATTGGAKLALILDDQVTRRMVTHAEVGEVVRDISRRGRPGVQRLTTILDERAGKFTPPASVAEALLLEALRDSGLPAPIRQYPFPGRMETPRCVDAANVDAMMIIEVDSRSWHERVADRKRDNERDAEAGEHGWYTHRVLAENVRADPDGEVGRIRRIREKRLAQLGGRR